MHRLSKSELNAIRGEIMFSVHKTIAERDHFWSDPLHDFILAEYAEKEELYNYNKALQLAFMVGGEVQLNDNDRNENRETPESRSTFRQDPKVEESKQSRDFPTGIRKV